MSIAPIVRSVIVKVEPPRAFELFISQIQEWWPKNKTIGREPPLLGKFQKITDKS